MNASNLNDLKRELKKLGFSDKLSEKLEGNMKKDVKEFRLYDALPAEKGKVEFTLHFRQSLKSDFYYFNKFQAAHNKGKGLKEGEQYVVTSPGDKEGRNPVYEIVGGTADAIAMFRKQEGDAELLLVRGEGQKEQMASAVKLASMEKGTVGFVDDSFRQTFFTSVPAQTFWVEQGKGYTAEQSANLLQGRAVFRDDLLSMQGKVYTAWQELNLDKERDRHGNLSINQYNHPAYGFELNKEISKYALKELSDPATMEKLEASLRNGNRVEVTVAREGREEKFGMEASVRYQKMNFFDGKGKSERREQFLREPSMAKGPAQEKSKEKVQEQRQGARI